jgi:hypothetical protein
MSTETVAINAGRCGNDCYRCADLRLGPPLSARAHVAGDDRARR